MAARMQYKQPRRYDIDWLRNFVIFLLIPFHTARIFDYWEPNYVKSANLSWGLSWFIVIIGYWFMSLMFWLAGASSWYALDSFLSCLGVYELLIRRNVLSRWLFGVKVKTSPQNTNGTIKM